MGSEKSTVPGLSSGAAREATVRVATGLRLHVVEWGAAEGWPVVILHGGGHHAGCWAEVCRRLPGELRCIVPDQRGHGASDRSPAGDYSCAAQVDDLIALLRDLAIERCAVIGHSMGGLNALLFAGSHPERVTALALVDVGTETRRSGLGRISHQVSAAVADLRALTNDLGPRLLDVPPGTPPGPRAENVRQNTHLHDLATRPGEKYGLARVRRRRAGAAARPARETPRMPFDKRLLAFVPTYGGDAEERRRLLTAARAPLLVMRGEHSRILSPESAALTASLGKGSAVEIPGAGHNVSLENPEAVAEALARFLLPLARSEA